MDHLVAGAAGRFSLAWEPVSRTYGSLAISGSLRYGGCACGGGTHALVVTGPDGVVQFRNTRKTKCGLSGGAVKAPRCGQGSLSIVERVEHLSRCHK